MLESDIEFAMYQMAAKHIRPPIRLIQIKGERPPYAPRQREDSYYVVDDLEQRHGVVKDYVAEDEEQEQHIIKMVDGIKLISSVGLSESEPMAPLDFAQAKVETLNKHFISLFSIPEGKTLLTHILYLVKQKEYSLERTQAHEILKGGYQQLAKALAELHTKRFSPVCKISEYYWKAHMDTCQAIVKSLGNYTDELPFDLADFSDKLIRMAAAAYANPCSAGFLHGNPLVCSIAYEPFSGLLSLLDLESTCHSIDDKGMPCGPSAYDFVFAEASLELQMVFLATPPDELQEILFDYRTIYKQAMRDRFPSAQHLTFYSVLFWLPVYKALFTKFDGDTSLMKEDEKRIFSLAYKKIEPVLQYAGKSEGKPVA